MSRYNIVDIIDIGTTSCLGHNSLFYQTRKNYHTQYIEKSEDSLKSGHKEVGVSTELSLSLDSHLKNKVVVKPGITFEDQSIENKLQCFHVKEYGKVLKI